MLATTYKFTCLAAREEEESARDGDGKQTWEHNIAVAVSATHALQEKKNGRGRSRRRERQQNSKQRSSVGVCVCVAPKAMENSIEIHDGINESKSKGGSEGGGQRKKRETAKKEESTERHVKGERNAMELVTPPPRHMFYNFFIRDSAIPPASPALRKGSQASPSQSLHSISHSSPSLYFVRMPRYPWAYAPFFFGLHSTPKPLRPLLPAAPPTPSPAYMECQRCPFFCCLLLPVTPPSCILVYVISTFGSAYHA